MNKPIATGDFATPKVTTGPIAGSHKVYATPDATPDLRVPLREIVLDASSGEPPLWVYDPSGPYTDDAVAIDVEKGLSRARQQWVRERGGVEDYDGRAIQPVDNGNVSGKHLARNFPTLHRPLRAVAVSYPPLEGEGRREAPGWGDRQPIPSRPAAPADLPPPGGGEEKNQSRDRASACWGNCAPNGCR